jgi:hypothetical protein
LDIARPWDENELSKALSNHFFGLIHQWRQQNVLHWDKDSEKECYSVDKRWISSTGSLSDLTTGAWWLVALPLIISSYLPQMSIDLQTSDGVNVVLAILPARNRSAILAGDGSASFLIISREAAASLTSLLVYLAAF